MATPPIFTSAVLTSAQMNAVGLWLVKSQTIGAGVGSVAITSCFNADYRNYRIVFEGGTQTVNDGALQLQFSATAGHYASMIYNPYNGAAGGSLGTFNQNFAYFGLSGAANQATYSIDVYAPFVTEVTKYSGTFTSNGYFGSGGGIYFNAISLTGFTIIFPAMTNTGGTVKVYGYRD